MQVPFELCEIHSLESVPEGMEATRLLRDHMPRLHHRNSRWLACTTRSTNSCSMALRMRPPRQGGLGQEHFNDPYQVRFDLACILSVAKAEVQPCRRVPGLRGTALLLFFIGLASDDSSVPSMPSTGRASLNCVSLRLLHNYSSRDALSFTPGSSQEADHVKKVLGLIDFQFPVSDPHSSCQFSEAAAATPSKLSRNLRKMRVCQNP